MRKYLKISSQGLMEIEALCLIGASTKRNNTSTIGQFGSGLKYSIATMIQQNINFLIFSGYDKFDITTQPVVFRGTTFNKIYINGKETSLTDSMGMDDWKGVWPFIREIYSNAIDEGEANITVVNEPIPDADYTTFFIEVNEEISYVINNFEQYFVTQSKYLYTDGNGNFIHPGVGFTKIYRKGIVVHENKHMKALFSYNLDDLEINESRVLKYSWKLYEKVALLIEKCTDKTVLSTFFNGIANANTGYAEHYCYVEEYITNTPSDEWLSYVKSNKFYPVEIALLLSFNDKVGRIALPLNFLRRFVKYVPDADILGMTEDSEGTSDSLYVIVEADRDMQHKIDETVTLLKSSIYKTRLKSPIKVCNFKGNRILGRFHNDTILLSTKLVTKSVQEIAAIIIEEQEHGITGYEDETREFQDHLFELLINAYKYTSTIT